MNIKAEIVKRTRKFTDSRKDTSGICSVCGELTKFTYTSWAIDSTLLRGWIHKDIGNAYLFRESMFCSYCNSNYRVRRLATELINLYSPECLSMRHLSRDSEFANMKILEINEVGSFGSLHNILKGHPGLTTTCYVENGDFGSNRNGKSIQNLESLTFQDEHYDLIIHSDVLEHIPNLELAKQEMYRVLKPHGNCVFTIPVNLRIPSTFTRSIFSETGNRVDLHKPLYHGRGGGPFRLLPVKDDYLEITSFGSDALDVLADSTVVIRVAKDPNPLFDLGEDMVFVASKNSHLQGK